MRFRPANIRLINRRSNLPRLLLARSSKNDKRNYNDQNNPTDSQELTGSLHISENDSPQAILNNQYLLVFQAQPGKKAGLQRVRLSTEVPNVQLVAADNVWVPTSTGSEDDRQ